jgi:hypothetical protein
MMTSLNKTSRGENITSPPFRKPNCVRVQAIYSATIPGEVDRCSLVGRVAEAGSGEEGLAVGDIVIALGSLTPSIILVTDDCQKITNANRITEDMAFWALALVLIRVIQHSGLEIGERVLVLSRDLTGQMLADLAWLAGAESCVGVDPTCTSPTNGAALSEPSVGPKWIRDWSSLESVLPAGSFDILIDASGDSLRCVLGLTRVRDTGRVVMMGHYHPSQFDFNVYPDLHRRSITLLNYRMPTSLGELYSDGRRDSPQPDQRLDFVRYLFETQRLRPRLWDMTDLQTPDNDTLTRALAAKRNALLIEW